MSDSTTFSGVSYYDFRKNAAEFFCATQDRAALTPEQADGGNKCLSLLYIGASDDWTEREISSAVIILQLATKRCVEVALANIN
jgi:hypothetical protein